MPDKSHLHGMHALAAIAPSALLFGCAANILGSREPPPDWVADSSADQCAALTGSYISAGMPAPANARAGNYGVVWPTEGSLISLIERGTNANPRKRAHPDPAADPVDIVTSIRVIVDAAGTARFEATNASGATELLWPQLWICDHGALTSIGSLHTTNFESHVRLWRRGDALIAEQTIHETDAGGSRAHPVARFHFRFPAMTD
ncbi:MAG TPA: hypothetical protein VFP60_05870 [Pseudolabrys sp.]|nr:hypothetical protein [Pseudolabrys sp.]